MGLGIFLKEIQHGLVIQVGLRKGPLIHRLGRKSPFGVLCFQGFQESRLATSNVALDRDPHLYLIQKQFSTL